MNNIIPYEKLCNAAFVSNWCHNWLFSAPNKNRIHTSPGLWTCSKYGGLHVNWRRARHDGCFRKISWNLSAAILGVIMIVSRWNMTGISATPLPSCLSNFRAIGKVQTWISRLRDFTRSCGKTFVRLGNKGPGWWLLPRPGGRLNKKDGLTRCGDSHVKDKTS